MSDWLPPGLFEYGTELAAAVDRRLGTCVVGDSQPWIEMPRRVGTTDVPSRPVAWGDGALCVDLGPDDAETWERFADVHRGESNPEAVAVAAQEWRLPVTPYRRLPAASARRGVVEAAGTMLTTFGIDLGASGAARAASGIGGVNVVDLTSMWAGPLCTELLGRAGAEVRKVSSAARPDGLAGTAMYDELNAHKTAVELDPRHPAGRQSLDELLARADILITSLSPRALGNLDLLPSQLCARHPRLRTLAITAFEPDSPERDWIAYGTGVHAASGLGLLGDGPRTPAFSYPDPLAGLLAAGVAVDQLAGIAPQHTRVSLAGAVTPLASRASCSDAADAPASFAPSGGDRHG
ncbi:CoA transferase [Candidatus Poriferisodalis sp.]|uniref:CoA transferase n=1 Tax=Candidatus Poriferisodalis sp. TaxID=3101277 RepID=UPI003B0139FE